MYYRIDYLLLGSVQIFGGVARSIGKHIWFAKWKKLSAHRHMPIPSFHYRYTLAVDSVYKQKRKDAE